MGSGSYIVLHGTISKNMRVGVVEPFIPGRCMSNSSRLRGVDCIELIVNSVNLFHCIAHLGMYRKIA